MSLVFTFKGAKILIGLLIFAFVLDCRRVLQHETSHWPLLSVSTSTYFPQVLRVSSGFAAAAVLGSLAPSVEISDIAAGEPHHLWERWVAPTNPVTPLLHRAIYLSLHRRCL